MLASALKVYPAAFALLYLVSRQYRLTGWFIGGMAVIVALSFALAGAELHWEFIGHTRMIASQAFVIPPIFGLESLLAQLHTYGDFQTIEGFTPDPPRYQITEPLWITLTTGGLFLSAILFLVLKFQTAGHAWRSIAFPAALFILVPLCGPLAWLYHFLPSVFLIFATSTLWGRWAPYLLFTLSMTMYGAALQGRLIATYSDAANFWQIAGTAMMIMLFLAFALAPAKNAKLDT